MIFLLDALTEALTAAKSFDFALLNLIEGKSLRTSSPISSSMSINCASASEDWIAVKTLALNVRNSSSGSKGCIGWHSSHGPVIRQGSRKLSDYEACREVSKTKGKPSVGGANVVTLKVNKITLCTLKLVSCLCIRRCVVSSSQA